LEQLRERGVWLVDASPVALYAPGRAKPSATQRDRAIRLSWDLYICDVIREATPRVTVVIGKGVAGTLGNPLDAATNGRDVFLPQPQARLTSEEHLAIHGKYLEICRGADV
jgi:hypothetical protein